MEEELKQIKEREIHRTTEEFDGISDDALFRFLAFIDHSTRVCVCEGEEHPHSQFHTRPEAIEALAKWRYQVEQAKKEAMEMGQIVETIKNDLVNKITGGKPVLVPKEQMN